MANCWLLKTPIQIVLILILIFAVPFLLAMIIVYAVYGGTTEGSSASCSRLCCDLRNEFRRLGYTVPVRRLVRVTLRRKRPKRGASEELQPPLVGSLVKNFRATNSNTLDFDVKCPVAIISDIWGLADGECDSNATFLSYPMALNDTSYANRVLRKVQEIVPSPKEPTIIAVKFQSIVKHYIHALIRIPTRQTLMPNMNITVYHQSWNISQPIAMREMIRKTKIQAGGDNQTLWVSFEKCQAEYTGGILIDDSNNLLGIYVHNLCTVGKNVNNTVASDFSVAATLDYLPWIRRSGMLV